jgi:CheY-like chemotaxis protein
VKGQVDLQPKILVVEDEQIVAEHLQGVLRNLGYHVAAIASTGKDAIAKVALTRPNLVLMDIHLQGDTDGIEAARVISWLFNIPVIFITAYSQDERFRQITKSNPFGYLNKPFADSDLQQLIEKALRS